MRCLSTVGTFPRPWHDSDGKAFQPQVHYFVGGATKLYGTALYHLRPQDFGELQHVDGVSPAWHQETKAQAICTTQGAIMSLEGKVAIVTGGNSGIGEAVVLALAEQQANVVIDYVSHPAGRRRA